ncbi:MAG TPA: LLM class F420-dependent oxidoreductase, partial [Thermoleophilaceae bacterium]
AARWALSLELPGLSLPDHEPVVRAAETAGYTDAWSGETGGHDGFTSLALAAAWSEGLRLGTGVVNVFTRGPAVLAQHAAALQNASGGRFCLGIGSSSNVIVERWNGIPFEKPRTRVRESIEFLRAALAGERAGPGGFKLEQPPPSPVPIYVAALRERMLQTAGELGDGAFVNFTPLAGLPKVMAEIERGAAAVGREPGTTDVLCRFFCLQGDPEQALPLASWMFAAYATVPVYESYFRWLGYGEAIDPMVEAWRAKDRAKAVELVPRDLVEDIFILGDADAQRARLERYVEGGITTPVLLPIPLAAPGTPVRADEYVRLVESLAPNR